MGQHIDIYTFSDHRSKETIERFLTEFTDRATIDDRGDEDLMLLLKGAANKESVSSEEYHWIKAETLAKVIELGLAAPDNCFTVYLPSHLPEIEQVMLSFTLDGKLIVGLSINEFADPEEVTSNYPLASALGLKLEQDYYGKMNYFAVEAIPPRTEQAFESAMKRFNGGVD